MNLIWQNKMSFLQWKSKLFETPFHVLLNSFIKTSSTFIIPNLNVQDMQSKKTASVMSVTFWINALHPSLIFVLVNSMTNMVKSWILFSSNIPGMLTGCEFFHLRLDFYLHSSFSVYQQNANQSLKQAESNAFFQFFSPMCRSTFIFPSTTVEEQYVTTLLYFSL